jgi:hypothetical protein
MKDDKIIARVAAVRRMAERLNLNFDDMLAQVLRRFPPESVKLIRAKLQTPAGPSARPCG